MTTRTRNAIGLLVAAAILTAAALLLARAHSAPAHAAATDFVPADARVVVWADLDALRRSPFAGLLPKDALADNDASANGCDRDAFDRASEVAVWIPGDTPDQIGIVAVGRFVRDDLVACSRSTIARRGGHPSVIREGEYVVVGDDDLGVDAARIAARADGVLLLGRPSVRTRMAAVGAGWSASASSQGSHARMREAVGRGDLVLSVMVDPGVREAARRFVGEGGSWLDGVRSFVLGVQSASTARLQAIVWCDTREACGALRSGFEARRSAAGASAVLRAAGISGLLDAVVLDQRDTELSMRLEAPASQVVELFDRIRRWVEDDAAGPSAAPLPAMSRAAGEGSAVPSASAPPRPSGSR